ncbi:deoxynucleotide monophosphate kinase family protein [Rhizobium rhizogenes]|uniref:deoxynucleotide monophosphate kinase family protein n=1 Tax=Rhizobium rhizogenes TaxID=359 RepID=UPI001573F7CB|nr:hypothetical protein [Rhizobium rhizogenes]NTH18444.1 hypothetical protein [Rhizobium rhizogenes]NTH31417.1 hypothetical protein [Rhizobium rhizogenes]
MKFAGPLKAMLAGFYRACGLDDDEIHRKLEGDLKEEPCQHLCGKTPRHAMETLGTEWGRKLIGGNLWTNAWFAKVERTAGPVVVDDVRFVNELEHTRMYDGHSVKLKPAVQRRAKSSHVAEAGIPDSQVDHIIENDSGIGKLRASIDAILYPLSGHS